MKLVYFKHSLFLLLAGFILCNCSNDDEFAPTTDGTVLNIQATAQGFLSIDGINTRAKEVNYTTFFTEGDAIGVFAQKDGRIIEGCKNLKLTFTINYGWTGNTIFYYKGAKYFAYYPYSEANNDKSVDEIVSFTPDEDQSTYANYVKNDLMATEAVPDGIWKKLIFDFEHKMSMVEISLLQEFQTEDASYKYSVPVQDVTFNIGGKIVKPYNMGNDVFRYIITPSDNFAVSGDFTAWDSKTIEYSKEGLSLAPNNYKRLDVVRKDPDGVAPRDLKVGDFYYSDGRIFPGETSNPPKEGCIGVICNVDKTFIETKSTNKAEGDFVHALVIALNDASQNTTWGEAVTAVSKYAEANATPENSTGWYFPNSEEISQVHDYGSRQRNLLNRQLNKVDGATQIAEQGFWVQMLPGDNIGIYIQNGVRNGHSGKGYHARAVLAF